MISRCQNNTITKRLYLEYVGYQSGTTEPI